MKIKLIYCLVLAVLFLAVKGTEEDKDFLSLAEEYVETEEISLIKEEGIRAARFKGDDNQEYYFIQSNDYVKLIGYEGVTNLAIIVDSEGKVESVTIIDSGETPYFIRRIQNAGFLEQFKGYPDVNELTNVTGATVSCDAINATIEKTIEKFSQWLKSETANTYGSGNHSREKD